MTHDQPPTSTPPAVIVAYRPHPGCAEALREICAGIEEEGIHSRTIALETTNATALAYEAASRSTLLVGVGVDQGELCVHVAALPADTPLEHRKASSRERACQRHIGHNAARLAKAMPLKGYANGRETDVLQPGEARGDSSQNLRTTMGVDSRDPRHKTNDAEVKP
jgi:propanediol dehydratase-reactivating factor small subunit